ncbi:MAG: response regulator, partial [Chloroflexi bacterium]|nr:response regulator [Chloroflexota bacterium]
MTDSELGCSGKLVLVVDDDRDIRSLIQIALTDAGHEVVEAGNGAIALELVRVRPPDLILLNVLMPVMNGFGFATRYRLTAEPRAPIVCITASPRAVEWCELAEADA